MIAMSEYDELRAGDDTVNRMDDSLKLFQETVNGLHFRDKPFINFYNKMDMFEDKLTKKSIKSIFPDYPGESHSVPESAAFIISKFNGMDEYGREERPIYNHMVTAINTNSVESAFNRGVTDTILYTMCRETGLA